MSATVSATADSRNARAGVNFIDAKASLCSTASTSSPRTLKIGSGMSTVKSAKQPKSLDEDRESPRVENDLEGATEEGLLAGHQAVVDMEPLSPSSPDCAPTITIVYPSEPFLFPLGTTNAAFATQQTLVEPTRKEAIRVVASQLASAAISACGVSDMLTGPSCAAASGQCDTCPPSPLGDSPTVNAGTSEEDALVRSPPRRRKGESAVTQSLSSMAQTAASCLVSLGISMEELSISQSYPAIQTRRHSEGSIPSPITNPAAKPRHSIHRIPMLGFPAKYGRRKTTAGVVPVIPEDAELF